MEEEWGGGTERWREQGGMESRESLETMAERVKQEGESGRVIALQQHLMASLERGREWRGGNGIMRGL